MSAGAGFAALKRLKAACCLIDSKVSKGTGYLVEERKVATCAHVVKDLPPGAQVRVRFGDDSSAPWVAATFMQANAAADVALLELGAPLAAAPLSLSPAPLSRSDWTSFGFPAFAEPLGVALVGLVMDPDAEIPGKLRGFALFSPMLGANPPESVGGLSGSPVVVGDSVIGHVSSVLGAGSAMKQPRLGYAYAAPIAGVLALLGRPVPLAPPASGTPASPERVVEHGKLFNQVQFAASGVEVHAALRSARSAGALTPELCLYAAEIMVSLALPAEALELLEGLAGERADQLRALSLSLQGKHAEAFAYTDALQMSAEARGIVGGMFKRRWLATGNAAYLRAAFAAYFEAYTGLGREHYPGINAAACALYREHGERSQALGEQSREIAAQIVQQLAHKVRDAWEQASYAEGLLLTGDLVAARGAYSVAAQKLGAGTRNLAVMRAQARRNLKHLKLQDDALDGALPAEPRAAAFSGHRAGSDLTPESIPFVCERLREILNEHEVRFGYCSAASGADLLFIEAMLERDAEVQVFLPFPAHVFKQSSVGPDPGWLTRFDAVLERVGPERVRVLAKDVPKDLESPEPYVRCNDAMQEAARAQARLLGGTPLLVAVVAASAEQPTPTPGGTAHALRMWLNRGERDVERIDPRREPA